MHHSKILYEKGYIKNLKMLTQSQFPHIKFIAKLENVKGFISSLKAINFDETATFQLFDEGLRVIVENSKFIQASLYISRGCFQEFELPQGENIRFSVNLNVLSECLSIFSGLDCCMKMIYKGTGAPLILLIEYHGENDIVTECSIKTKHHQEPLEYEIDEDGPSFNSVIIRGPDLSNLFNEIDKSAEELEILLSPNSPYFRISTIGVMQSESNIEVSKTSDMIVSFTCRQTISWRYKLSHIKLTMKALLLASKVAIRTDSSGLLGLQLMILADAAETIYIEYFITPLINSS